MLNLNNLGKVSSENFHILYIKIIFSPLFLIVTDINPSSTIICRIDGIELPSLTPKCVGFTALKFCEDYEGFQPSPSTSSFNNLYFNSSQQLLPIIYGKIPSGGIINEETANSLPHIDQAYLSVRLLEVTPEEIVKSNVRKEQINSDNLSMIMNKLKMNNNQEILLGKDKIVYILVKFLYEEKKRIESEISSAVVGVSTSSSFPPTPSSITTTPVKSEKKNIPPLLQEIKELFSQITPIVIEKILKYKLLPYTSFNNTFTLLNQFLFKKFPILKQKIRLADLSLMFPYKKSAGVFCSLDMLFNMPDREYLIDMAKKDIENMKIFDKNKVELPEFDINNPKYSSKVWKNQIKYFKTYFRYLVGGNNKVSQGLANSILDDASLDLDLQSRELNPKFNDNFSHTVGIELNRFSTLLVVVTAVDILTKDPPNPFIEMIKGEETALVLREDIENKNSLVPYSSNKGESSLILGNDSEKSRTLLSYRTLSNHNSSFYRQKAMSNSPEVKSNKVLTNMALYFGHGDPQATWWGVIPLFKSNNIPYYPIPESEDFNDYITFESDNKCIFINEGTHQLPLFQGLPPQELFSAYDPYQWVLDHLEVEVDTTRFVSKYKNNNQNSSPPSTSPSPTASPTLSKKTKISKNKEIPKNSWYKSFLCTMIEKDAVIAPDYNSLFNPNMLPQTDHTRPILSPGASAFIRIVDPRLRSFGLPSVSSPDFPQTYLKRKTFEEILNHIFVTKKKDFYIQNNTKEGIFSTDNLNPEMLKKLELKREVAHSFSINTEKYLSQRKYDDAIPIDIYKESLMLEMSQEFIKIVSRPPVRKLI